MRVQKTTVAAMQHELERKRDPMGIFVHEEKRQSFKRLFFSFQSELVDLDRSFSKERVPIVLELDSRDSVRARMV